MSESKAKNGTEVINDGITVVLPKEKTGPNEPTVSICLPLLEDEGSDVEIDQTVTVTINGKVTQIRRGEHVDVKVPVYLSFATVSPTFNSKR